MFPQWSPQFTSFSDTHPKLLSRVNWTSDNRVRFVLRAIKTLILRLVRQITLSHRRTKILNLQSVSKSDTVKCNSKWSTLVSPIIDVLFSTYKSIHLCFLRYPLRKKTVGWGLNFRARILLKDERWKMKLHFIVSRWSQFEVLWKLSHPKSLNHREGNVKMSILKELESTEPL